MFPLVLYVVTLSDRSCPVSVCTSSYLLVGTHPLVSPQRCVSVPLPPRLVSLPVHHDDASGLCRNYGDTSGLLSGPLSGLCCNYGDTSGLLSHPFSDPDEVLYGPPRRSYGHRHAPKDTHSASVQVRYTGGTENFPVSVSFSA